MAKKQKRIRTYERAAADPVAITPIEYGGLQEAYDHFNKELFGSELPDVFITYQRHGPALKPPLHPSQLLQEDDA